jgi:mRNA-degrading endonuclease RelE of RelBE toxin-antitoxin system
MAFDIQFTALAAAHVRSYRKFEQRVIFDGIEEQLTHEPGIETRNRKRLGQNEFSDWELRIDKFRVFYDIVVEESQQIVKIKAVGHKEHNKLFIGQKEVQL